MSLLALSISFECVMGIRPLEIFRLFQCGYRLYRRQSRQIQMYKDDPRSERVQACHVVHKYGDRT